MMPKEDIEDYRFPALKCRLESYREFMYSPRGRSLELEGIYVYKGAVPRGEPEYYFGYLDPVEEYKLLGLKAPQEGQLRIPCLIPVSLVSRDRLATKPNLRVRGTVHMESDRKKTKHLLVEDAPEFLPIAYKAVGTPKFDDLWDMFASIYKRETEMHERGSILFLASLIGSERCSVHDPLENAGCGINIGASPEEIPGKVASGRITPAMRDNLGDFIRRVNIGQLNKVSERSRWSRFLSISDPGILGRHVKSGAEIDWNLLSDLEGLNNLKRSSFIASDMNLVYDPALFPPKISREDAKDVKQTLLFARSTPPVQLNSKLGVLLEVKAEKAASDIARCCDYAPFLFRYRFEPLCDAFLKGMGLTDYILNGDLDVRKSDMDEFFKIARHVALDFAGYAERYIDPENYIGLIEGARDLKAQDLLRELIVRGRMSEDEMTAFLIERHELSRDRALSIVADLLHREPALVLMRDGHYTPI